jgi:hypothetical protein
MPSDERIVPLKSSRQFALPCWEVAVVLEKELRFSKKGKCRSGSVPVSFYFALVLLFSSAALADNPSIRASRSG